MNEQDFLARMTELQSRIDALPAPERDRLAKMADDARQRHERLRQTVAELQEALDGLRLTVKYLVFDLEATRRENQYLRQLLADQGGGG